MKLHTRTLVLYIAPEGEPVFAESGIRVSIDDKAEGEYVLVQRQCEQLEKGQIFIDPREWPALREAIDRMIDECSPA